MTKKQVFTILTAEDDAILRKSISAYLRKKGYVVLEANDGAEALEIFRAEKPDLILSDLRMPEMDGFGLFSAVREESIDTPFIIVSGIGKMGDVIEALRNGVWDYITKPIEDMEFLYHAVASALEKASLLKESKGHQQLLEKTVSERTADLERQTRVLEEEILERKIAEMMIVRAKKEWERTVDAMPDLVALVDRNFRMVRVNKAMAKVLGKEPRDLVDEKCLLCFRGDNSPPDYCPHALLLDDGQPHTVEIFDERLGGHYEVTVVPYFEDEGGKVVAGSVHVARDINSRKKYEHDRDKLQTRLLHAQKLESVGQLAAGIAHEINTPTQYVGSNVQFLQEAFEDIRGLVDKFKDLLDAVRKENISPELIEEVEELLEEVDWEYLVEEIPQTISQSQDGIKRVTSIVRAMKEFSHPGSKDKKPVDLNHIITTTITVATNEWKYVARIETDLSPDLPSVPLLTDEMGQVILNLLVNGAQAIAAKLGENPEGEKGVLSIQSRQDGSWVEVRITDSGTGIPEEARARVFDPFFTTKKVGKGTGQGLAIAHDVVTQKHGGDLSFETEMGKGTTLIIRLPLAAYS
ncbi:MAG: response regulator, partial [Desulfobulbaceae bacterium]|nr:response regulator [Candidatus Desulfobia pelagia]